MPTYPIFWPSISTAEPAAPPAACWDAGGYVIAGIDKDEGCRATYLHNNGNDTLDGNKPAFLALDMFPAYSHNRKTPSRYYSAGRVAKEMCHLAGILRYRLIASYGEGCV